MATERQIAANRRNAGKSTGPRSRAGKQRARRQRLPSWPEPPASSRARRSPEKIEKLARKIAGNRKDEIILEHARDAAYAAFDLARVRRVKLALTERASALGTLGTPRLFGSVREAEQFLNLVVQGKTPPTPNPVDPSTMMLTEKFEPRAEPFGERCPNWSSLIDMNVGRRGGRRDKAIRRTIRGSDFN